MAAQVIDGKTIAKQIRDEVKQTVEHWRREQFVPGLAVVLVGDDPASATYVRNKEKACQEAGIYSEVHRLDASISEDELLRLVHTLNHRPDIHGILVQLPLPEHIRSERILDAVDPSKDVDGFHPVNAGKLLVGKPGIFPCTPLGVIELLKRQNVPIAGRHAVVVGRSNIVGKPAALLLLREHATVSVCHSRTPELSAITRQADILVCAVGQPELIRGEMIKPGACVIDVGINRTPDGKLVGDVCFSEAVHVAGQITPVPGGVGPMTIAMLLKNTLACAQLQRSSV
ncbi:MAG: bifunctional 5,10-methylene-tetrahydrofolate dehydrogenase/5,10-methylene-tetrahydrofolate cyclohydrolase [Bacillus thermozeamaize]|uniref:Bifunctional protein FolD n=1 Tax=Bacillus thermozeamaize TaxID=230954 RepID=A0A1Y3PF64_9BACI|nr:MAG: bifunctional 5,10-methylene-tetrahydrofolate dehydrogenase/5,10-methylene-tetrahydrofolate cyclohydrolase [Bacillus thermozeamaize]